MLSAASRPAEAAALTDCLELCLLEVLRHGLQRLRQCLCLRIDAASKRSLESLPVKSNLTERVVEARLSFKEAQRVFSRLRCDRQ